VLGKLNRGFESHPLRHTSKTKAIRRIFDLCSFFVADTVNNPRAFRKELVVSEMRAPKVSLTSKVKDPNGRWHWSPVTITLNRIKPIASARYYLRVGGKTEPVSSDRVTSPSFCTSCND
jgi:hypothetical protein